MGKANSKLSLEALSGREKSILVSNNNYLVDKKEIQTWHQAFLKECPSGILSKERFLQMYENFFPFGDPTAFAGQLYRLYDPDGVGGIRFCDYLNVLSVMTRGKLEEKLKWAFQLYDQDGDGRISRKDLLVIVDAIYRMVALLVDFPEDEDTPAKRVNKIFVTIGKAEEDSFTLEEFKEGIQNDPAAIQSLLIYDGIV